MHKELPVYILQGSADKHQAGGSTVLFRTMRSRDRNVVVVKRTINLGYWEFGMGREWGGVEKGEVSLRVT
jgi:hypothetical protein